MNNKSFIRAVCVTGVLSAAAFILMMLEFSVPLLMPAFIKFDFSDLPALIASFGLGPWYGLCVCLIKNLLHLTVSQSFFVGELANFLLGAAFVLPAGFIYRFDKTRKGALIGSAVGCVVMALLSVPVNYFLTYPVYVNFMPLDAIIDAYQAILPSANGLLSCLLIFNLPFTFVKGAVDCAVAFVIYKPLSPLIKGIDGGKDRG